MDMRSILLGVVAIGVAGCASGERPVAATRESTIARLEVLHEATTACADYRSGAYYMCLNGHYGRLNHQRYQRVPAPAEQQAALQALYERSHDEANRLCNERGFRWDQQGHDRCFADEYLRRIREGGA